MGKMQGAGRRFLGGIPVLGPLARWVYRAATAPSRLVEIQEAIQTWDMIAALETPRARPTLDVIRELRAQVEPYQPLYGCPGGDEGARRPCIDCAEFIERALDVNPRGLRLLNLGSSLGYFSFYFAERGARALAVETNPAAVALSRCVAEYNGLRVAFRQAEITPDFVRGLGVADFDVALVLSVLHRIIHAQGLAAAQSIMATLSEHVPVLFVELATRDEAVNYPWRELLPADPLDTFAAVRDCDIEKIAEIPTHISSVQRPLYRLRRRGLVVNGVRHAVNRMASQSYPGAEALGKTFHFGPEIFAKRLRPTGGPIDREVLRQALREVVNYENLRGRVDRLPVLRDYAISPKEAVVVFDRIEGENLLDLLDRDALLDTKAVFEGVVRALADLRDHGLYHNDVRSWNVMVDVGDRGGCRIWLIDLGHAEPEETDDTREALLWLAHDLTIGRATRDIGWPIARRASRNAGDYARALRPIVADLLEAPSFDEYRGGLAESRGAAFAGSLPRF